MCPLIWKSWLILFALALVFYFFISSINWWRLKSNVDCTLCMVPELKLWIFENAYPVSFIRGTNKKWYSVTNWFFSFIFVVLSFCIFLILFCMIQFYEWTLLFCFLFIHVLSQSAINDFVAIRTRTVCANSCSPYKETREQTIVKNDRMNENQEMLVSKATWNNT